MSARYSNTSSRGLEIVDSTVNGSTPGDSRFAPGQATLGSGHPMVGQPHGVPELRPVHEPRPQPELGIERPAELAVDRPGLIQVDPLSDQRRTPAAVAALAPRIAPIDRPAHQRNLQS